MSTVILMVEILIIGIQAGMGLLLLAMGLLGYGVIHKPLSLLDAHGGSFRWMPLLLPVFLAACYTLGILIDRLVVLLFNRWIRPWIVGLCPSPMKQGIRETARQWAQRDEPLVLVLYQEKRLSSFLQDYRSRLRIARATVLNTALMGLAFCATPHLRALLPRIPDSVFLTLAILGGVLFGLWIIVWAILQVTYEERLGQAQRILKGD